MEAKPEINLTNNSSFYEDIYHKEYLSKIPKDDDALSYKSWLENQLHMTQSELKNMINKPKQTYIIVDLEATCCDKNSFPREEMEIIEIGAVALNGNGPNILDEFQSFIKPVRNPILTSFCTKLTTINQEMVNAASTFSFVLHNFKKWLDKFNKPIFCSWGNYDKNQLLKDCEYHNVNYPFNINYPVDDNHINIKKKFSQNIGIKKGLGLGRALKHLNMEFDGTAHRGIDDAKNMAKLSKYIFK